MHVCGSTRSSAGLRHRLGAVGHRAGPDLAGRPDRRRPEVRQPRSGRAIHGGRGGVRRHPARRTPEPVFKAVFTRKPFRLADLAELVYLLQGTGTPDRKAVADGRRSRRPLSPPSRSRNSTVGGSGAAASGGPPGAAGGRRAGAAVSQAVRRHAVPAAPLGVRRDRLRLRPTLPPTSGPGTSSRSTHS